MKIITPDEVRDRQYALVDRVVEDAIASLNDQLSESDVNGRLEKYGKFNQPIPSHLEKKVVDGVLRALDEAGWAVRGVTIARGQNAVFVEFGNGKIKGG